jgi:hypothetical protein
MDADSYAALRPPRVAYDGGALPLNPRNRSVLGAGVLSAEKAYAQAGPELPAPVRRDRRTARRAAKPALALQKCSVSVIKRASAAAALSHGARIS